VTATTGIVLRHGLVPGDSAAIERLVAATGFFSTEELAIARELADAATDHGHASGYEFLLADGPAGLAGYACFGRIPGTETSFDLYWIVVSPHLQGQGVGRWLLAQTEAAISALGGNRLYVDTSSRAQYAPTRRYYAACGYVIAAELPDFYRAGDGKVIFLKVLERR
jgi:GNAT superfamily N-acetyltransferase